MLKKLQTVLFVVPMVILCCGSVEVLADKSEVEINNELGGLDFRGIDGVSGLNSGYPEVVDGRGFLDQEHSQGGNSIAKAGTLKDSTIVPEEESKVPFLGDLPLIGRLFRSRSEDDPRDKTIIMVTPEIVKTVDE